MFQRLALYFQGMFPPLHAISTLIYAYAFFLGLHQLADVKFAFHSNYAVGAISLVSLVLLIRVMDEFKDYEDDLINFPDRPLPSGQVKMKDLKVLGTVCFFLPFVLNMGNWEMWIWSTICLGFSLLMLKWFFLEEKMRKNLPLALVSHHPIAYLYLVYLSVCFMQAQGLNQWHMLWFIIPVALPNTNWEFSRKLRSPSEEDSYTTYSKIWGARPACLVALATQLLCLISFTYYYAVVEKPVWFIGSFIALFAFLMVPYILFLIDFRHAKPMKKYAEGQMLYAQFALMASYFI